MLRYVKPIKSPWLANICAIEGNLALWRFAWICHNSIGAIPLCVKHVILFLVLFLQPQLLQIHLSPANLTTAIHFTLASHKQISTNFNTFKIHCHYKHFKISTHHTNTRKTTLASFQTKNRLQICLLTYKTHINNLHISTIVFHFRHILFLHDLLIHLFFPFHISDHHLAKGLSLSSVHDSGIHSLLIPKTHLLYQYSVPGSKHTFSKLRSSLGSFPSSLTVYPYFDSCYSHFMPYRTTPSVRHKAIEVHYYYYYYYYSLKRSDHQMTKTKWEEHCDVLWFWIEGETLKPEPCTSRKLKNSCYE